MAVKRDLDAIRVPIRARKELGDVDALAASIDRIGLLHPVVVNGDGDLIAGARRLEAVRRLGWSAVDVTVATSLDAALPAVIAERDENECRKAMTPEEAFDLAERLRALEEEDAARRRREGNVRGGRAEVSQHVMGESSRATRLARETNARLGGAVGMSPATYERARAVVNTARNPSEPQAVREAAQGALEEMNRTGKVGPAARKVKDARRAVAVGATKTHREDGRTLRRDTRRAVSMCRHIGRTADNIAAAVPAIDVPAVRAQMPAGEVEELVGEITSGIQALTRLRRALKGEESA